MKNKFLQSLEEGYKNYLLVHARSPTKIIPMHKCISNIIKQKLGNDFTIKSMGIGDNKEFKFKGKYYSKDLDITILKNNKPISALGFKFVTSNYKQNSNNYFENMLGETANVKRNDLLYGQILILKEQMPYFSTDKRQFTKVEKINELNLKKYFKLGTDNAENLYHKPDIMFITFVETGDEERMLKAIANEEKISKKEFNKNELFPLVNLKFLDTKDLKENFTEEMTDFLIKNGDFEKFIDAFVNLTKGKTYGRL
jgi:hypothetical protein